MEEIVNLIIKNKEWLFSGAGIIVIGWVIRILFKKVQSSHNQTIRSGDNSSNYQAGRDLNIPAKKRDDVE